MPLNPTLVADGQITNVQEMAVVMRNAVKRLGYVPSGVRAAYSGSRGIVRLVTIPQTPGVRPELVLDREARRILGVGVDQNHVFWRRLGATPTEQRYVLVAVPRPSLNSLLEALVQSHLRPDAVQVKGLALARVTGEARALIVNLEQASVTTTLTEGYLPELLTSNALDEAIAFDEEGLGTQLVEEVRPAVEYFAQRFPGAELRSLPVYLTGGHPLLNSPRFPSALTEALSVTVSSLPELRFSHDEDFPLSAFLVNLGLVMNAG
ncbi:MAG: hypothetical protein FJX77_14590 [Armatimonadetes bacterium]|nr:hypothetical protein [Armatimonadota bacterium]MBM3947466.1 hypothetical protein [SAR202 cluster bacterium]